MRWRIQWRACVAAAACLTVTAAPAAAFDLNGTWTGKISCKGIFNSAPQTITLTPTVLIEDDGSLIKIGVSGVHYNAVPFPTPGHEEKGELAIIRCDTSSTRSGAEFGGEFGRMKVTTNPRKGTASLSGTSFEAATLFAPSLDTCRWALKRISTASVSLGNCTEPPPP
jgi:hypothetical protein